MSTPALRVPFDLEALQAALEEARIDLLMVSSDYNRQYMLGGYRRFFFAIDDSLGLSRAAPVLCIPVAEPEASFYVGHVLESSQLEFEPLWVADVELTAWSASAVVPPCAQRIRGLGLSRGTVGIESAFLPTETYLALRSELPDIRFAEAAEILEDLRAVKQEFELELIRAASERVVASMVGTFGRSYAGISAARIAEILREEEAARGLDFVYGQVMTGPELYRYPSDARRWQPGAALALDSGGAFGGYLGDLTRMAVLGEPSQLQRELLDEVDAIQMAARGAIHAGAIGSDLHASVEPLINASAHRAVIEFIGEGTGLVGHEAPRLATSSPLPSPGRHHDRPLEPGMVLGVETTLKHPQVGAVKLEDVVVVTSKGHEGLADSARDWTVVSA